MLFVTATPTFASILNCFILIQGDHTLSRKNCPETSTWSSWMYSRAIQCKQATCTPILSKSGKGCQCSMYACLTGIPHLSPSVWAEKNYKCMASLYKHMGILQRAITLILRSESKFLKVKSPFCAPMQKLCPLVLPIPP